jgi:Asp-tRNA(Asn)/Glu-tRNA(Gln) amidotransferase B subunit
LHDYSAIDLNRAGTPLLEIVSDPDMRSAKEAVAYAKKIHALVQYIDICVNCLFPVSCTYTVSIMQCQEIHK